MEIPKISIVTPSFNQGNYLEETIKSVIDQDYPNIDYVIIDGCSTDNSRDIIKKYEHELAYWVSELDSGQYDAINKGFSKTTGEIMGWINSDDKYTPWAFSVVAEVFSNFPQIDWLTTAHGLHWDSKGRAVRCGSPDGFNKQAFFRGANLVGGRWHATGWIQQESTFWRRDLWEKTGGKIDSSLNMAGDFDLWAKFFSETDLYVVSAPLGGFRVHGNQKTTEGMNTYLKEGKEVLRKYGAKPYGVTESTLRDLVYYCTGRQAIPRKYLPSVIAKLLDKIPLFNQVEKCIWRNGEWKIERSYMV